MSEIDNLKRLRNRIIGFQASNNVYRVIDEEIRKLDPTWVGDFSWQRKSKVVDRNELVETLKDELDSLRLFISHLKEQGIIDREPSSIAVVNSFIDATDGKPARNTEEI